mmetsp:Transcript_98493/g.277000  ORF Transcript_98493/g.277000 Transcript_98493/m.277000 type:complete len:234 (-) Transcript_98493:223-924(-)
MTRRALVTLSFRAPTSSRCSTTRIIPILRRRLSCPLPPAIWSRRISSIRCTGSSLWSGMKMWTTWLRAVGRLRFKKPTHSTSVWERIRHPAGSAAARGRILKSRIMEFSAETTSIPRTLSRVSSLSNSRTTQPSRATSGTATARASATGTAASSLASWSSHRQTPGPSTWRSRNSRLPSPAARTPGRSSCRPSSGSCRKHLAASQIRTQANAALLQQALRHNKLKWWRWRTKT